MPYGSPRHPHLYALSVDNLVDGGRTMLGKPAQPQRLDHDKELGVDYS